MTKAFFYGTLRSPNSPERFVDDYEHLGEATINGMSKLGNNLVIGGSTSGHLFEIPNLEPIDTFEANFAYHRREVEDEDEDVVVIYVRPIDDRNSQSSIDEEGVIVELND